MLIHNEQAAGKESFYHLDICCTLVAEKYGQPHIAAWTNSDYLKLSGQLFRHTNIQISPSTLKRIFGKLKTSEKYYPQKATRDALVQYVGFANWEIFVLSHLQVNKNERPPEPVFEQIEVDKQGKSAGAHAGKRKSNVKSLVALIALPVVAILVVIWQMQKREYPVRIPSGHARIVCTRPQGETPHSTTFKIQLAKNFSGDREKFTIDFGDGRAEKQIDPERSISHFYEIPGRYYAVLRYNGYATDTTAVFLKTAGWTATAVIQHDSTRAYPVNLTPSKKGILKVTATELRNAGVDTSRAFFVHFVNTKPFEISGDNFELSLSLTTSLPRPGIRCSQTNVIIYGEKSSHEAILIKPGCVSWAYLRFSEIYQDGEKEDLSFLGADLSNGGRITLRVLDKKVTLSIDDKIVYRATYVHSLGNVYGMRITFGGLGVLNGFTLKDLLGGKSFSEGFH